MQRANTTETRDVLPIEWLEQGLIILHSRKIDELNYQNKTIKERLFDSMSASFVLALLENVEFRGLTRDEALARLRLDRTILNRWMKNEVPPHARVFFGLLIVGLRADIDEVDLPSRQTVIWQAVCQTMAIIREKECGKNQHRPKLEKLSCVKYLIQAPRSEVFLENGGTAKELNVIEDVLREVRHQFPRGTIRTTVDVRRTAAEWLLPYVLFRIGLQPTWEFLNEPN